MGSEPNMMTGQTLRDNAAPSVLGALSGSIAAVAAGDLFAVRNLSLRPMAVSEVRMSFATIAAITAGTFSLALYKATGFTAIHTGGTPVSVLAQRRKTSGFAAIPATEIDCRIAGAALMTGGTYTVDGDEPFAVFSGGGSTLFGFDGEWLPNDGLPLCLEQNEGIIGRNLGALAGTGPSKLFVGLDFFRFT